MLDQAFAALKTYDWGPDRKKLNPIDQAVIASHDDTAARAKLENRMTALLETHVSRAAKDFLCRKLMIIGTAASVPSLAKLLPDKHSSHMARYALERIPAPEAAAALRTALPELSCVLKIGVIGSLGVRQDAPSVPALATLLDDADPGVARAAAIALGDIHTPAAANALLEANPRDAKTKRSVSDAALACAEGLLADGNKARALAVYRRLAGADQPKYVRLAATRGMLMCAGRKQ